MVEEKILAPWKIRVIWTSSLNLCLGNIRLLCGQKFISLCLRLIFPVSICLLSSELKLLPRLFWYERTCGLWWECTLGELMVGSHSWLRRKGASKEQPHEKKDPWSFSINAHAAFYSQYNFLASPILSSSRNPWVLSRCCVTQPLRSGGIMLWLLCSLKYPQSKHLLWHGLSSSCSKYQLNLK